MKKKVTAKITGQELIAPDIYSLWLETELAQEAKPGQFVGVYLKDPAKLLMRPISICDVNEEQTKLRLVYRAGGEGTKELARYALGEDVELLGMLGNGYDIEWLKKRRVLLLGGGIGIPPMLYLAEKLCEAEENDTASILRKEGAADTDIAAGVDSVSLHRSSVIAVLGYADKNTFLKKDFDRICPTYTASMDGSIGTKGTVIDAMDQGMLMGDVICACGPMPMLKAVKAYAADLGMKAYISLEERMACGVGACLGCVTKTKNTDEHTHVNNTRICVEGPVFDADDVIFPE